MSLKKLLRRKVNKDMKKEEVNILKQKIHKANEKYLRGEDTGLSDPQYDSLVEQLVDIEGEEARP